MTITIITSHSPLFYCISSLLRVCDVPSFSLSLSLSFFSLVSFVCSAFGDVELDVNFLQLWVAVFQFLLGFLLIPLNTFEFLGPSYVSWSDLPVQIHPTTTITVGAVIVLIFLFSQKSVGFLFFFFLFFFFVCLFSVACLTGAFPLYAVHVVERFEMSRRHQLDRDGLHRGPQRRRGIAV